MRRASAKRAPKVAPDEAPAQPVKRSQRQMGKKAPKVEYEDEDYEEELQDKKDTKRPKVSKHSCQV